MQGGPFFWKEFMGNYWLDKAELEESDVALQKVVQGIKLDIPKEELKIPDDVGFWAKAFPPTPNRSGRPWDDLIEPTVTLGSIRDRPSWATNWRESLPFWHPEYKRPIADLVSDFVHELSEKLSEMLSTYLPWDRIAPMPTFQVGDAVIEKDRLIANITFYVPMIEINLVIDPKGVVTNNHRLKATWSTEDATQN